MLRTKLDRWVVHETEPFNAEPHPDALAGLDLTPVDTFYARNHGPMPDVDAATWRLAITGQVDHPLTMSLEDLRAGFAEHEVAATLQCAGNRRAGLAAVREIPGQAPWGPGAISTAAWRGARLADVLAAAHPRPAGRHVAFQAPDIAQEAEPPQPYGASIPMAKALGPEVLLAWSMNGEPLPREHGGPVRVVVPGFIGARSVKWVQAVSVQVGPSPNYFQAVAYRFRTAEGQRPADNAGPPLELVSVTSDILSPAAGAALAAGPVTVTGYAFSGGADIASVQLSVDAGGSWRDAVLRSAPGPWAWRHWSLTVELAAGPAELVVRAVNSDGAQQPADPLPLWNPKGYANNAWARVAITVR